MKGKKKTVRGGMMGNIYIAPAPYDKPTTDLTKPYDKPSVHRRVSADWHATTVLVPYSVTITTEQYEMRGRERKHRDGREAFPEKKQPTTRLKLIRVARRTAS